MKRTGPNDVSGVVWAIGEYFSFFFHFFFGLVSTEKEK